MVAGTDPGTLGLLRLHERMEREGAVLWVPGWSSSPNRELHLVAVTYSDDDFVHEGAGLVVHAFLGYVHDADSGDTWTGSPVLRECERLWRGRLPLVLDLDETLGSIPNDSFSVPPDITSMEAVKKAEYVNGNGDSISADHAKDAYKWLCSEHPRHGGYSHEYNQWCAHTSLQRMCVLTPARWRARN